MEIVWILLVVYGRERIGSTHNGIFYMNALEELEDTIFYKNINWWLIEDKINFGILASRTKFQANLSGMKKTKLHIGLCIFPYNIWGKCDPNVFMKN